MAVSAVLIWFYFRKKLRLIDTTANDRFFTLFMSWILLSAPVIIFLFYLVRETGELTHLKKAEEILNSKPTMYYSIDNSFQHKNKTGMFVTKVSVDRGNEIEKQELIRFYGSEKINILLNQVTVLPYTIYNNK